MRVIVADDEVLLREGLIRLLSGAGSDVIGKAGDAAELLRLIERADRTSPSSTSRCRKRTPTKAWPPLSTSANATPRSAS